MKYVEFIFRLVNLHRLFQSKYLKYFSIEILL